MPSLTGCVSASFVEVEGRTRLSDRAQAYPLKIAKAFPFDEGQLGVYIMDASPGIMSGDRYVLDWRFGEQTRVYVTNQSYTKVHPARYVDQNGAGGLQRSEQVQTLQLGKGSFVEYMPEPLMLYKDAVLCSSTDVQMEAGSALLMTEIVCPGRTHRGEVFQYSMYQNKLTVHFEEELIYCSKQRIEPQSQRLGGIGSWEAYTHIGSLYLFCDKINIEITDQLREFLDAVQQEQDSSFPLPDKPLYYGISHTYKHGLVLSVMGNKVYEIQRLLDAAWQYLRHTLFAKPPLLVRK